MKANRIHSDGDSDKLKIEETHPPTIKNVNNLPFQIHAVEVAIVFLYNQNIRFKVHQPLYKKPFPKSNSKPIRRQSWLIFENEFKGY